VSSEKFETRAPAMQNLADLFEGEWSSELPAEPHVQVRAGNIKLFEDPRIEWARQELGGFAERRVLELGPLEGGHTYMIHRGGAREIVSVEANRRAFLKCLCVKELYDLSRARFLLGDFVKYLDEQSPRFDVTIASGVLYHMIEPIRMLDLLSKSADRLFIWTHYYDADLIAARNDVAKKFGKRHQVAHSGRSYEVVDYGYKDALKWAGFTGGTEPGSRWISRATILGFLRDVGYQHIKINFDQPDHPHGPAFALCASR
jgi:Protein of unknown function (DUF1698)